MISLEPWSEELQARLTETAPADRPPPDFRADYEAGRVFFFAARDADRHFLGCVALRVHEGPELEIVGLNMARAPFMMRTLFTSICAQADVIGARISCMIEKEAMEKLVNRFDFEKRATLYEREARHVF